MSETPTFIEGEEEVQYVVVSLPSDLDPVAFGPGSIVTIEGLATEQPVLKPTISQASSSNGTSTTSTLQGQYVDNLGSILLVKEQPTAAHNTKPSYAYVGHTDKQLQFQRPS